MNKELSPNENKKIDEALEYPGVAVNIADNDKVSESLEKERTCTLNNNPRNSDMKSD